MKVSEWDLFSSSSDGGGGEREEKRLPAHSPFFSPRLLGALPRNNKEAEEERRREGKRSDQDDDVDASSPPPHLLIYTILLLFSSPSYFFRRCIFPLPLPAPTFITSLHCSCIEGEAPFFTCGLLPPPRRGSFLAVFLALFPDRMFRFPPLGRVQRGRDRNGTNVPHCILG